ncbi:hypothetical protein KEM54_005091 [Ascosphaera aggregata]|nr:hypothetical protein KEM54_005091 [Ascosphaera aggregata]
MGRKPNAIVTEFFNRGAKLHDASNRYEHTCKLCGQNFPKGRSDSLLGHLTKTCPAISAPDRARVQSLWPGTSDRASKKSRNNAGAAVPIFHGAGGQFVSRQKRTVFNTAVGGLHGLNVLAEASRQVGAAVPSPQHQDFQAHPPSGQTPEERLAAAQASNIALVDPALEATHKQESTQNDDHKLDLNAPHHFFANADTSVLGAFTTAEALSSAPEATSDTRHTSQLSLIAASASEMVHQDTLPHLEPDVQLLLYRDSLNNPFYQSPPTSQSMLQPVEQVVLADDSNTPHADEVAIEDHQEQQHSGPPVPENEQLAEQGSNEEIQVGIGAIDQITQRAALYPRPIAIQPIPAGSASFSDMPERVMTLTKTKGRSQFSEERRREVQLVRQLGACLRCRMLKKTVRQCKGIQNPRVWMECCIRSRLTSQLEVYFSGLQSTLAWQGLVDLERQTMLEMYPGRIEACHFDTEPPKYLTFSTFMGIIHDADAAMKADSTEFSQGVRSVYMINTEMDGVEGKLDQYMKNMAFMFYETEPSHVIKSTLLAATQLSEKTEGGDELLDGVLQLWIATRIITDPNFRWKLYINPTLPSSSLQSFTPISNESGIPITETSDPQSNLLITTQLRAGAEKCAEKLSKSVLNKIEQRLLQKQRAGQFRTFLGALVLINCAERMTWLYQAYQNDGTLKWPLDSKPEHFVGQGERFAGIVSAHLKMRSLAPASIVSLDDLTLRATDTDDEDIINWFYSINMTCEFALTFTFTEFMLTLVTDQYLQSRETAVFDPSDCRSLDLKYGLKLFRPPQNEGLFTT